MIEEKRDPTRTKTLRKRYAERLRGGFGRVMSAARTGVVEKDVFRLTRETLAQAPDVFRFNRDDRKVQGFMEWWRRAEENEVMSLISRDGNPWIQSAYSKGVDGASRKLRDIGVEVEGELTEQRLNRILNLSIHRESMQLAYTRNYQELDGITAAVDQQVSRELAEGLAEGLNPRDIADNISDRVQKIGKTRSTVLARTEVISAYNDAALNRYSQADIEEVVAEVEWLTAGIRVCPVCEGFEGKVFSINEARGLIPAHPQCRCTWVPRTG